MRQLQTSFRKDGFTYTQIHAAHPIYVFEQRKGGSIHWEVVKARPRPDSTIKGRVVEAYWAYPGSNDWGLYGFTCQTLERAMEKATELNQTVS